MKPATKIRKYSDWPKDVVGLIVKWNKERWLRFPQHQTLWGLFGYTDWFRCSVCKEDCEASNFGDVELDGVLFCDECFIEYIRRFKRSQQ